MRISGFKAKVTDGAPLAGTFLKTPAYDLIEVLATSGLDFLCIDREHSPWGRRDTDAALAMARALDFPVLVRVAAAGRPEGILQALDMGAVGCVVPHVTGAAQAASIAKSARFSKGDGMGGRGFAGATRWAGYGTRTMAEVLDADAETVVLAQIEEPEALTGVEAIAAVDGIDGLFLGPADMSVSLGETKIGSAGLEEALARTGAAARGAGKGFATFVPNAQAAEAWRKHGAHMFFVASEQGWMKAGAAAVARGIHDL
ncbi:MAG: HpcH/HpaI aldolase family protein [Shimia sp.]